MANRQPQETELQRFERTQGAGLYSEGFVGRVVGALKGEMTQEQRTSVARWETGQQAARAAIGGAAREEAEAPDIFSIARRAFSTGRRPSDVLLDDLFANFFR